MSIEARRIHFEAEFGLQYRPVSCSYVYFYCPRAHRARLVCCIPRSLSQSPCCLYLHVGNRRQLYAVLVRGQSVAVDKVKEISHLTTPTFANERTEKR